MKMDTKDLEIRHNEAEQRFETRVGEELALIEYQQSGHSITFTHTEVPEEFEGRGVGGQLARAALDYARQQQLKVVPLCSFVAAYIKRHAEYQDLVESQR